MLKMPGTVGVMYFLKLKLFRTYQSLMSYNFAPLLEAIRVLATLQKTKLQISPKTTNQRENLGRFIEAEHAVILFEMIKNVKCNVKGTGSFRPV